MGNLYDFNARSTGEGEQLQTDYQNCSLRNFLKYFKFFNINLAIIHVEVQLQKYLILDI